MSEHAPGPWSIDFDSEGTQWTDSISIADADGGHVAHLTRGYEGDTNGDGCPSWANACLIAAAPDLLAALQLVMRLYTGQIPPDVPKGLVRVELPWVTMVREAIVKATDRAKPV